METTHYLGLKQIGELLGVPAATVSKWRTRYAENHPCPQPDAWIGDTPGWSKLGAASKWKAWKETLPGQGRGGGPFPLATAVEELGRAFTDVTKTTGRANHHLRLMALHLAAAQYGVDKDTIMGVWGRLADENPDMPSEELDQRALATIMRGRKRLELTTGEN